MRNAIVINQYRIEVHYVERSMTRALSIIRGALGAWMAAFLVAGCEFTTSDQSEGTVSLAELQGQNVAPETQPPAQTESTSSAPATTPVVTGGSGIGPRGGGGGFLWKPVGENSRKLVILLPPQYTGQVSGVYVANSKGGAIEAGSYTGVGNGNRTHWRFSKPGSGYGQNILAVANLKSGGAVHWPIPNGASRTSY
jgi:hypothetical protein